MASMNREYLQLVLPFPISTITHFLQIVTYIYPKKYSSKEHSCKRYECEIFQTTV